MTTEPSQITLLLQRARDGDYAARDELMNIVYAELHRLAKNELRRDCRAQPFLFTRQNGGLTWQKGQAADSASFVAQRHYRVHLHSAPRGDEAGE